MGTGKIDLPEEVRKFFQENGRKGGNKLLATRGTDYFKKIAAQRKTVGNFINHDSSVISYTDLAETYGVSRQRIQQIIKKERSKLSQIVEIKDENSWRMNVIKQHFNKSK